MAEVALLLIGGRALWPPDRSPAVERPPISAACKLFTLPDAAAVLGPTVLAASNNGAVDATSSYADISACAYITSAGASAADETQTVSVLVRSAKSTEGARYNKSMFGAARPPHKQTIHKIGDTAFWDATLSQLNVLKGDTWYIIGGSSGDTTDPEDLNTALAVYRQIKSKL